MEEGHSFGWWAGQSPQWYLPNGALRTLRVQNYMPILDDEVSSHGLCGHCGVPSLPSAVQMHD
eukprot:4351305-Amphidinium_carterae.1